MTQQQRGAAPSASADTDTVAGRAAAFAALGVRTFASLSAMNAATGMPDGTIAQLPQITTTNNYTVLPTVWSYEAGKWYPLEPLLVSAVGAMTDLTGWLTTYSALAFRPFSTLAIVYGGTSPLTEYIYIGTTTGFFLWRGDVSAGATIGSKYTKSATYGYAAWANRTEVIVNLGFDNASGSAPAANDTLCTFASTARPAGLSVLNGLSTPGTTVTNQPAAFTVSTAGVLALLGPTASATTTAAASKIVAQGSFIRALPAA